MIFVYAAYRDESPWTLFTGAIQRGSVPAGAPGAPITGAPFTPVPVAGPGGRGINPAAA
jgi:hypothetical protein